MLFWVVNSFSYLVECLLKSYPTILRRLYETTPLLTMRGSTYIVQPQFNWQVWQIPFMHHTGVDFGVIAPGTALISS